jgi:hypothetical protein
LLPCAQARTARRQTPFRCQARCGGVFRPARSNSSVRAQRAVPQSRRWRSPSGAHSSRRQRCSGCGSARAYRIRVYTDLIRRHPCVSESFEGWSRDCVSACAEASSGAASRATGRGAEFSEGLSLLTA